MTAVQRLQQEIPEREQSTVEKFRLVALQFCDADAAASLMEELKTTTLAKMKADLILREGPMADNKAEMTVKASRDYTAVFPPALIEPCIKAGCPVGGTVLDPFGGAGTTALVAKHLKRNAVLIELNPEYAAMAERRIDDAQPQELFDLTETVDA